MHLLTKRLTDFTGGNLPPLPTNLNQMFHQQAELIASINLFTEEVKMVDQLKQDCCIAHAVRGDNSSQSSPKWEMMKST